MTQIEETLVRMQAQLNARTSQQATGISHRHEDPALEAADPES
jgi:hypothetical protein